MIAAVTLHVWWAECMRPKWELYVWFCTICVGKDRYTVR